MAERLLNYTTKVPASQTTSEIMGILARMGADEVQVTYVGQGIPSGIAFTVVTGYGERSFRLPARLEGVLTILQDEYDAGNRKQGRPTFTRATDVAWRILKDWIEAQAAIVAMGMATVDEVMLPYMLKAGGPDGVAITLYEDYAATQKALPPGGRR